MSFTRKRVEKIVKKIIAEQIGMDVEDIKNEMSYIGDLNADSLDIVELIMSLEEEFELEVPDEEAEKMLTVQDTLDYVHQRLE